MDLKVIIKELFSAMAGAVKSYVLAGLGAMNAQTLNLTVVVFAALRENRVDSGKSVAFLWLVHQLITISAVRCMVSGRPNWLLFWLLQALRSVLAIFENFPISLAKTVAVHSYSSTCCVFLRSACPS